MTSAVLTNGGGAHVRTEDPDGDLSRAAAPSRFPATPEEDGKQEACPPVRPGEWWPRTVGGDPWLCKHRVTEDPQQAAGG